MNNVSGQTVNVRLKRTHNSPVSQHKETEFRSFDTNGNGFISKDELTDLLLELHPGTAKDEWSCVFEAADLDNDGYIEYDEFVTWICKDTGAFE